MIASRYLLDSRLALGTVANIPIAGSPSVKVRVNIGITLPTVPRLPALEAHLKPALTIHPVALAFRDEPVAVRSRTPLEVRVCVHVNILLELEVLLEDLLRAELPNIFSRVLGRASRVCSLDLLNLAIGDVERYVVSHAVQTESMRAGLDSMKILFSIVFIADVTSSPALSHRLNYPRSSSGLIIFFSKNNRVFLRFTFKQVIDLFQKDVIGLYNHISLRLQTSLQLMIHCIATAHPA